MLDKIAEIINEHGGQLLDFAEQYWIYILIGITIAIFILLRNVGIPFL